MSLRPRPEIEKLQSCPHGGPNLAELKALGLAPDGIIDFSVSSNPFAPPPGIRRILSSTAIDRYPDSEVTELRQRLSEKLGVAPDNILAGNGSMEIIRLIAMAYFRQGDSVLILEPTFGEYEIACQIAGAKVIKQWARAEADFAPSIQETTEIVHQNHPRGVFICNPNNPTGNYLSEEEVKKILDSSEDSLLILDEAFIAFVDDGWSAIDFTNRHNIVIVRSMTKDYSLAGLRLGYAVAHRGIIENLRRVCPPWNVNTVAQRVGGAILEDAGYLQQCKQKMAQSKRFLLNELHRIGFTTVPSPTNFFLVKVGDARAFRAALLQYGILVRDCTSFELPEYVRLAVRPMPECRKLIAAIRALKDGGLVRTSGGKNG